MSIQSDTENLIPALDIVRQALREPALEESEMEIIRRRMKTSIESGMSDPQTLAFKEFSRKLDPQPKDDVRYTPTLEEDLEMTNAVTLENISEIHKKFLSSQYGEVVVVGDFKKEDTLAKLNEIFADWTTGEPYESCLLYTSPSPRDRQKSRMPSSA